MLNIRCCIVAVRRADKSAQVLFTSPVVLQFLGLLQYMVRVYMLVTMFTAYVLKESTPPFWNTDPLVWIENSETLTMCKITGLRPIPL